MQRLNATWCLKLKFNPDSCHEKNLTCKLPGAVDGLVLLPGLRTLYRQCEVRWYRLPAGLQKPGGNIEGRGVGRPVAEKARQDLYFRPLPFY
ncbi:hypothetical protein D3C86_1955420 [compost metagenome]